MSGKKDGGHRRTRRATARVAIALVALGVAGPASAAVGGPGVGAPPPVPELASPADGAVVPALPTFAWQPAPGADRYEFEIAADPGFNSPVLGGGNDQFPTRNTRATLKKTVPNGTYFWHVRSVSAAGEVSAWSPARSFQHSWLIAPTLLSPVNGAPVVHPTPLTLRWTPVPRAKNYVISIATDPELGSLVGGKTLETVATTLSYPGVLAPGRYYWGVTPLDGGDHRGAPSAVGSFTWTWPSRMGRAPRVSDFADQHAEIFDPNFSWDPVPGAASYQVEVWSSEQPDLKVCCDGTSIGTSLAPTVAFKDNTYFWRVRALDAGGHAGDWNDGATFKKAFAEIAVQNLRMRDHLNDPGTDLVSGAGGYQTEVPIVTWDPVPGASSYDVEVAPFQSSPTDPSQPPRCNWTATSSHWTTATATTAWTPLGAGWNFRKPYSDAMNVSNDFSTALVVGTSYCVRVRPRDVDSSLLGRVLYGDYTYLNSSSTPAFQWTGYPAGDQDCTPWPDCDDGYLRGDFYLGPSTGATTSRMPLFTWRPLAGKRSYFVLVAKDSSFHTIVDYAFTQVPAYAPRTAFGSTTYQDETTHYYWAVLPAVEVNGNFASGDPTAAAPHDFQKMSTPPTLRAPSNGSDVTEHPTFHWTPVEGVRRYRLEVSQEPTFRTVLEDNCGCGAVVTDSTGYTPKTTYPADTVLYWRVRAEDDKLQAMVWSVTGTFQRRLPAPVPSAANALSGDFVPAVTWSPIHGAVSYDFDVDQPDGTHRFFTGIQGAAFTPSYIYGTGIWRWRVRANFAKAGFGVVPGPYSDFVRFTRTLREPPGQATNASPSHVVLSWEPKDGPGNGVQGYRVQVSTRPDFSSLVEDERTENTAFAPTITNFLYAQGGTFYWRVASTDGGRNTGDFTGTQSFTLPAKPTVVPPPPPGKATSRTTARVSKTRRAVRVSGSVSPAHRGRVTVTLLRNRGRVFVRVAAKRPALNARSRYATSFARPRRGRCRVTVRFPGDADHLPSGRTVTFAC